MFEELSNNIETEVKLVAELNNFFSKIDSANVPDSQLIGDIINSIKNKIRILNNSIPTLITHISLSKSFHKIKEKDVKGVKFREKGVLVKQGDLKRFMEELKISKVLIKKLKKGNFSEKNELRVRKRAGFYSKLSNKLR